MFTSPGAVAISTNFFTVYWYGIIIALAFLIGQYVILLTANKEYKEEKLSDTIYELAFWALFGGIIGARLYYVCLSFQYFWNNPIEIIMINHGGLSVHGGLLGGIIFGYVYLKKNNLNFLKYADLYALGLPIGQAIGRWGNFFNSEAFGLPTTLPWGIYIPPELRPDIYKTYAFYHPTFLYECLWDIVIFLILYFIIKKYFFNSKGVLFFSYLILYSIGRIAIESIRIDSVLNIFNIPVAIWISIVIIIISSVFLLKILKH